MIGRRAERDVLDRLRLALSAGESRVLVLHGEAGTGKSALLEYLAGNAPGARVAQAAGVQSEMELPFAGLHQLCGPLLAHLQDLPAPQRDALRTIFGLSSGPAPDRFLVGLAVLSLLSQAARERPLLCVIDDFQWLDRMSGQMLAFTARRLGAESVGLVLAVRGRDSALDGLPDLKVTGLPADDARVLLDSVLPGTIDCRVRDQLIAETRGNPLALLELPRGLTPGKLAGGFGLPAAMPLADSVERSFRQRISALPTPTQRLLLLAAADPSGDPALVWRAAARLGIDASAATAAIDAGIAEFGTRLLFRHPLARSAAYQPQSAAARREVHRALAEVTDLELDPDRRAWHRAQAAAGPEEDVAAELERSASRASARGGLAAAAAFLERAAELTPDPGHRATRFIAAAQAQTQAGAYDAAGVLLDAADAGPLTGRLRAHAALAHARLVYFTRRGPDAPPLLLDAARQLAAVDPALSRATYHDALTAARFVGRLSRPGYGIRALARAVTAAPPTAVPRAPDLMMDATASDINDGFGSGTDLFYQAMESFGDGMSAVEELRWLWPASMQAAARLRDEKLWDTLSARYLRLARERGALSELPRALTARAYLHLCRGELDTAAALAEEALAGIDETRMGLAPALWLAALRGEENRARALSGAIMDEVTRRGEGIAISFTEWANALLDISLGRYGRAAVTAWQSCLADEETGPAVWTLESELIEAAVRARMTEATGWGRRWMEQSAQVYRTDWGLGLAARGLALVSEGPAAEDLYREAITRLGRTRLRVDLARAHLLFGEWLRSEGRRADARDQLRTAHDQFQAIGLAGFAERARRELSAAGETARKRTRAALHDELTAQEALIARLARDGLSNPEIGVRLFLSAHTVQYHLRKIFAKLGITSRAQIAAVMPGDAIV